MTTAEQVFADELRQIRNPAIKQLVIDAFKQIVPDYFWTVPASTTGKYHPKTSLGLGGLVRHTKMAVWWGVELCSAFDILLPGNIDCVIAALLLHDGYKNGPRLKGTLAEKKIIAKTHGGLMREKLLDLKAAKDWASMTVIANAIAGHMGKWSDPMYKQFMFLTNPNKISEIVHIADYCASRKSSEQEEKLLQENDNATT